MRSQILKRRLASQQGQTCHVSAEQGDVGLEEGQNEGSQGEVGHLLKHLVEIGHGNGAGLWVGERERDVVTSVMARVTWAAAWAKERATHGQGAAGEAPRIGAMCERWWLQPVTTTIRHCTGQHQDTIKKLGAQGAHSTGAMCCCCPLWPSSFFPHFFFLPQGLCPVQTSVSAADN